MLSFLILSFSQSRLPPTPDSFVKNLKIGLGRASGIINLLEKRTKIPVFVLEKRTKTSSFILEKRTKTIITPVKGLSLSTFAVLQVTWSLYASIYVHIP